MLIRNHHLMKKFMMSRHISLSLLRNYSHSSSAFKSIACFNHLPTSLPNLSRIQRLSTPASIENIQSSKVPPSLTLCPTDDILSSINKDNLSVSESVTLLKSLREQVLFKGIDGKSFKNHPKFEQLCLTFQKSCYHINPNLLISGLRSLLEVGLPSNSACIVSAEEAIIMNINKFTVFNLIGCLHYHYKFVETDQQKKVVSILVSELQKRLLEVRNATEVVMLVRIYHLFDELHKKKIEQKIIEMTPLLDTCDINKIICTLAETSNRNISILNVMAFYLRLSEKSLELKEVIDLCYAFKKLNYFDPKLFAHLLNFQSKITCVSKPALISGLLAICGHIKWKHAGILDACGLWIKTNFEVCRTREFVAYILALGAVNHVSFQTKVTLNLLLPHLTLETVKSHNVFLDIAWSLCVLDCIPKDLLLEVLSPKFYKSLLKETESQVASSLIKLKLLNLKGILKMKYPECVFGCNLFLEPFKLQESSVMENSRKHVIEVLSNLVPVNKCMSINQVGETGVFIDAEFIMKQNKKPLPLQDYGILSKPTTRSKPLPKDARRLALLVMFHKDFTACNQSLTGINALGARLLTAEGYEVVHIPYNEFSNAKTEVEKAKYLLRKISDHLI